MRDAASASREPGGELPDLCWSIAESSPLPMAAVEGARHIVRYANPAFCLLLQKAEAELVGIAFLDMLPAGDELLGCLDRVSQTGQVEFRHGQGDPAAHQLYYSYVMWPVLAAAGSQIGILLQVVETTPFLLETTTLNQALLVGSVRQHELTETAERLNAQLAAEILERKQTEIALVRSNADLQQFADVTSHDLQEPLRAILNFAELLARRYEGRFDAEANEFLSYIVSGARRMRELIHSLLAYSRIAHKDALLPFVLAPLGGAVDWAMMNLQIAIQETRTRVTQDELPTVNGDQSQLIQLFQNLIGNAIKYRRPDQVPEIHIFARQQDMDWVISVRDNGIGIKPEQAERIFGVFKRLHGSEIPGNGIGLAICKRIVENHDGRIWVESDVGHGSSFCFTLPG